MGIARSQVKISAESVRVSVTPIRCQSSVETGCFHSSDWPKSPWKTMREIHFQYCT